MATIAIGDVHGNLPALDDLLRQLRGVVRQSDVVVFLGDYIDRGPQSRECIDAILGFERDIEADVVCLCGNHEDWLLRTRHDFRRHSWLLGMEGFDTIRSYSVEAVRGLREAMADVGLALYLGRCALPYDLFFDRVPSEHLNFFENLRPFYRSPECLCSHAGLDSNLPAGSEQTRDAFIWGAGGFPDAYRGVETVVYGHRDNAVLNADGWPMPAFVGRTIGIDTISHGVLTAIMLPEQRVFQSARYRVDPASPTDAAF